MMNDSKSNIDEKSSSSYLQPNRFVTTSWSLIADATTKSRDSQVALEELCQAYWYPLYAFVRRKGHQPTEAEELTQDFFAHLLSQDRLQLVDESKGRFRSFLLKSLENFLIQKWRKQNRIKRGGGVTHFSFDFQQAEQRYMVEPVDRLTPQKIFDQKWALELLDQALRQLRATFDERGKSDLFAALQPQLIDQAEESYTEIGQRLQMNEIAVKVAAHRMRQKFRVLLVQLVQQTVRDTDDVDAELAELFAALGNG